MSTTQCNTSDLIGPALDWAVAKCEGEVSEDIDDFCLRAPGEYCYSTDWAQAGPIIERERIWLQPEIGKEGAGNAWYCVAMSPHEAYGETPLIAAMRCYVASKLGDEVEIPEELA